ncbi:MAG TPA: M28 family peptidase, partial [Syntrophobacteraceae bacterium]|nr:M28 family peptidase [Syntrophobacteraceae bacterium]
NGDRRRKRLVRFLFFQENNRRSKKALSLAGALIPILFLFIGRCQGEAIAMIDTRETAERLRDHVRTLTVTIGERSMLQPENLEKARLYIESFYQDLGLPVEGQFYQYGDIRVGNVISRIDAVEDPSNRFLVGAHYDSVGGTVGADDNAAAIAVQLETARALMRSPGGLKAGTSVKFVSFTLEEPPTFATRYMGSRVYARDARGRREKLDGMICLEMVGYYRDQPGSQSYPFPLMFMNYPKEGNFIGIVGNSKSRGLTRSLEQAFRKNPHLPVISLTVPLNGWLMPPVRLSDHSAFWDEGYQAVMVTDSAFYRNPHYHLPSDTMDKLDFRRMAELVKSLLIFLGP